MFIGQTRFSLFMPGSTNWRASDNTRFRSENEYLEYLYSEERLEARTKLFLDFSLPQLADAARGYDVTHLVSYSDSLPAKYQRQLEEAAAGYDFLQLDRVEAGNKATSPVAVAKRKANSKERLFIEYRLDDDDMLAVSYFDQLSAYARPEFVGMYVSFGAGIAVVYVDGKLYDARTCRHPMVAIGLAKICGIDQSGDVQAPKNIRHVIADTAAPVILDSRELSYVWTRHDSQDTAVKPAAGKTLSELREYLRHRNSRHPLVEDMDEVERHFPHIVNSMTADLDAFPTTASL